MFFLGKFRWDSSDPDRAPPPLPLNPGSASPVSKTKTSPTVAAAQEALQAKARESIYTLNPLPSKSPEKSLIKGQYHKRMQSLQTSHGSIRDLSGYLENTKTPEQSPEKPLRPTVYNFENWSPEKSPTRSGSQTPTSRDLNRDSTGSRLSNRPPLKAILGENAPPSATMLALQNTPSPRGVESTLADITNGASASIRIPHIQSYEGISSQILGLTSIATNLQKEMAQLSRRSKDNATDLISLKEATKSRDEDIRQSLKELVHNLSSRLLEPPSEPPRNHTPNHYGSPRNYMLDNKPYATPPVMAKNISLPRIPSPTSFSASIDREFANSPSPYSIEGAAGIALLEKILREMGTKEGQERLLLSLSEFSKSPKGDASDPELAKKLEEILMSLKKMSDKGIFGQQRDDSGSTANSVVTKKLEEILSFLKSNANNGALVARKDNGNGIGDKLKPKVDFENDNPMQIARNIREVTPYGTAGVDNRSNPNSRAADFVNEDIHKLLKRLKDSVTEGGGLSAEIKALVRELRGEVLGMGREIGRKLEQAEATRNQMNNKADRSGLEREEIAKIVGEGLSDLKEHMDRVLCERRRASSSSTMSRTSVDSQEVYHAVKNALSEMDLHQAFAAQNSAPGLQKDDILAAIREAWDHWNPDLQLQGFGLEREEILQCLKDGLKEHMPQKQESQELNGATYEEVLEAVQEGLKEFKPPPVETEASLTREELIASVRECLESFDFPTSQPERPREPEITREDVVEAVREGLSGQTAISKDIEVNRDDLFDAIRVGLESIPAPVTTISEQILEKMEELIEGMKAEFKQYSSANGRDTEQVLDAVKDGLEVLRSGIETYVDRAADVTGKDEIIETVRDGLDHLRNDLEAAIANAPRSSTSSSSEILDAMEKEFEHLRQTIVGSLRSVSSSGDKEDILDAIRDGFEEMKGSVSQKKDAGANAETLDTLKEELEHLRETISMTIVRSGSSLDKDEILDTVREALDGFRSESTSAQDRPEIHSSISKILDAFNVGLDALRADLQKLINKPTDTTVNEEILDTLRDGLSAVRADIDRLRSTQDDQEFIGSNKGRAVVIADPNTVREDNLRKNDIENLEVLITQLQVKVEALDNAASSHPQSTQDTATKEQLQGLEMLMREVQASVLLLDELHRSRDVNAVSKDDTDAIETLLRNTKAKLDDFVIPEPEGVARIEHLESVESTIKAVREVVEDLAVRMESESVSKEDFGNMEKLLKEVQTSLEEVRVMTGADDPNTRVSKEDIETLEAICIDTKTHLDELNLPNPDTLPTKSEMEGFIGLVKEFKEKAEAEASLTAQAFEARKIEHGGIADKVEDVKCFLDDVRQELKSKLNGSQQSIESVNKTLETLSDTLIAGETAITIKELMEIVKREFDRSHGYHEGLKLDTEQSHSTLLEKQTEGNASIIKDISGKIDARFDELMIKYDDAQRAAESDANALNERNAEQSDAMNKTRTIAEDLKILADTLSVTMAESSDRISEDSRTVFNKATDIDNKIDTSINLLLANSKTEHQLTRAELSKAAASVEGVHAHTKEYHPKILNAITDVLNLISQHFEQAQQASREIKTSVEAIPLAIPAITAPPPLPQIEEEKREPEKYDDSQIHAKLDQLVEKPEEKYDDSEIHAKLDLLVEQATEIGQSKAQVELLERIDAQVAGNAAEFRAFMATQQSIVAETQHARTREAGEAAIALEKRIAQKQSVEADINKLSQEKKAMSGEIEVLRTEHRELLGQKSKLQADLSSLETALQIRREEMHFMEARAQVLERRILEGVLDHSRSLLLTSKPNQSSLKSMNLKRVTSSGSSTSGFPKRTTAEPTVATTVTSAVRSGVDMAIKRHQPQPMRGTSNATSSPRGDRRILSLSTIGGNRHQGTDRSLVLANSSLVSNGSSKPDAAFGAGGLKRSHSVKSNFPVRKTSWGGTKQLEMYADDLREGDKENSVLDEEDEEGSETCTERKTSYGSYASTERKTSYTGTYSGTGSYGMGSIVDDDGRSTSYAASVAGNVHNGEEDEEYGDQDPDRRNQLLDLYRGGNENESRDENRSQEVIMYGLPSDSGIGTDLPTATLEGGSGYFRQE
ncbi:MAG: hypothetical protein MMC33_003255 [Icmadophila ericetorum]|nr:hypothetical protein [Icmadophila ericetorum]